MLTPDGQAPAGGLNQAAQSEMPDIGNVLGGLAGGDGGAGGGLDYLLRGLMKGGQGG